MVQGNRDIHFQCSHLACDKCSSDVMDVLNEMSHNHSPKNSHVDVE